MHPKTVIIVGGPTASGKTAAAIRLAQHFRTEIISADSRQCFQEMNIGVARPSAAELAAVPHHFIASHSIQEKITAATFEGYALQKAETLFRDNDVVVMVGGTGLYIQAFCDGFDAIPEVPEAIQLEVRKAYATHGLEWLQAEVARLDPSFFVNGETQNPQRLMRALEVFLATGNSILNFRKGEKTQRNFQVVKLALDLPRPMLHQRINQRVDAMMESGLEAEVRSLSPYQHLNALQTVGYRELFAYFDNHISLVEAVEKIKSNTRQYAKRQLTWFRKDAAFHWFLPEDLERMVQFATAAINKMAANP
ncbi:tRNA dimethylallyltransferase [Cnuella takakiae]|uniref:tRNA dimethylallyltransferase n=1 Tax=Cnuella takakiae TaxID=1302690 RepID=A0A1M4YC70_9BACT|nr:tRNA (adenosine(37)-N6)-dimethylallyltransferase MiaA [Cnuella takakiae]OLY93111.1 tRNA (adenosine(37)-N6)-dimethylallyltransferase MiaA [Cnuella takakiae]SHF03431.1 tRNA dimethylallyltransferase [Cnuella takakiae]